MTLSRPCQPVLMGWGPSTSDTYVTRAGPWLALVTGLLPFFTFQNASSVLRGPADMPMRCRICCSPSAHTVSVTILTRLTFTVPEPGVGAQPSLTHAHSIQTPSRRCCCQRTEIQKPQSLGSQMGPGFCLDVSRWALQWTLPQIQAPLSSSQHHPVLKGASVKPVKGLSWDVYVTNI